MVPSDAAGPARRGRIRTTGRILLAALLGVALLALAGRAVLNRAIDGYSGSGFDHRRFDDLESAFQRDQAAFEAADARMQELVAAHPDAVRIGWSQALICVRASEQAGDSCQETDPADQALLGALPTNSDVIVHQAKDPGRTFFRFFQNDPPMYTVMHAPGDEHPERYIDDRGFRSHRSLMHNWTLLAPISDDDRDDEQWLL